MPALPGTSRCMNSDLARTSISWAWIHAIPVARAGARVMAKVMIAISLDGGSITWYRANGQPGSLTPV